MREWKKQRTRETIISVALELFAERGYARTTLKDIAEAAEVSTGTLFAYFPSKEDILFPEERPFYEQLQQKLEQRPPEATTFDVLREFLGALEPPDETFACAGRSSPTRDCVSGNAPEGRAWSNCSPIQSKKISAPRPATSAPPCWPHPPPPSPP